MDPLTESPHADVGDEADAREKLQYDFHYLRRQSVAFDLRIVARTLRCVLGRDGR